MTFEKLNNISLLCRKRQEKNKDVLFVVTGEKGDGKSNYTMQQARDYVSKFGLHCRSCNYEFIYSGEAIFPDRKGLVKVRGNLMQPCPSCKSNNVQRIKKFDFNTWLAYDADELEDKIYLLPKFSPVISDELARFALAENWNSAESKSMKKLLMQCRTKNLIILGNIPDFITLDKKYRNMSNYWVRILQRDNRSALAVFVKRSKGEIPDKFHMKEFQEILGDYFEDTPMDKVIKIAGKLMQKHPCVEDHFMIPPMPQDMYDEYERYRDAKVFERNEEEIVMDQRQMGKVIVYNIIHYWKELTEAIKNGRREKPSLRMIEDIMTRNPKSGKAMVRYTTLRNWIRDIEAVVRITSKNIIKKENKEEPKENDS